MVDPDPHEVYSESKKFSFSSLALCEKKLPLIVFISPRVGNERWLCESLWAALIGALIFQSFTLQVGESFAGIR